ncbi:hypothetical protein ABBQ38_015451 [Trebouxia sp. C0009 RCD-2024]
MERRMDTYKALVPDIKWVANPVKPQTVINARRDLECVPGCNQKDGKQELAVSRRVFALEDVHAVARRLHKDETGLRAARVAWRQAKAEQQAEAGQRRAHQAQVAEQRKKKLLSLLPEHPLRDPKKGLGGFSDLDSWVLDEAVAAYTGTAASLQAALDIYKRNFFLASECSFFHKSLEALKMDVRYHKKRQRSNAKNQPQLVQPHCIGLTEPELRAAAEKEVLWQLGCQLGYSQVPSGCPSAAVIEQVRATAFQRVLDMPTLPNMLKKQVAQAVSQPIEQHLKESRTIIAIRNRCSSQNMADMLHREGFPKYGRSWKEFVGDAHLYHDYPSDDDPF